VTIQGVDLTPIAKNPWFGAPDQDDFEIIGNAAEARAEMRAGERGRR
jgi:hypothetical protein